MYAIVVGVLFFGFGKVAGARHQGEPQKVLSLKRYGDKETDFFFVCHGPRAPNTL